MSGEQETIQVQLARMEGKLDLSNHRHSQHDARFLVIDGRLNAHGERLGGLEAREIGLAGERKGITTAGKWLWAIIGLIAGGIGAMFKAAFGL